MAIGFAGSVIIVWIPGGSSMVRGEPFFGIFLCFWDWAILNESNPGPMTDPNGAGILMLT